jgi:predicted PhzF superfamily epimerase YddE/YHI9
MYVFFAYYGIPEDPATGSGNGYLAGYLVKRRYFGTDQINLRVEQGYEIGRSSLLRLKTKRGWINRYSCGWKSHNGCTGSLRLNKSKGVISRYLIDPHLASSIT